MEDRLNSAHFLISYDPPGDGNCQFSYICETLRNIGLYRSVKTLREEIVEYLKDHPHMQNFITDAWPTCLQNMAKNGTFGYHLTLQAAADLFNVEFNVISSLGPAATTVILPQNSVPILQKEIVSTMSPCKTMPCGRNVWKKEWPNQTKYQNPTTM